MKDPQKKGDGRRRAGPAKGRKPITPESGKNPEWTQSLRQLYDSVVDEPLPDAFKSLLEELDKRT
ncbi:MAG TPA: NepR family anti-sigma factor [Croceibacterium sp.]|nr:NepR family anti-sigma factor [Croceibacterium sp.]